MEKIEGLLILTKNDLNLEGRKKKFKNFLYTDITDIAYSLEEFRKADYVIFVDDESKTIKFLKSRYKIELCIN